MQPPIRIPRWIAPCAYIFVPVAAATLLILHTLKVGGIQIDTVSLGLLVLILLVPLAPRIRRLNAAGIEAEIGPTDARQLQASASALPIPPETTSRQSVATSSIEGLTKRDPPLGLAQLRIELERELQRIYVSHLPDADPSKISLGAMAYELRNREILPDEVAGPLADVAALANRAVHGEYVPATVASDIAEIGFRVLAALQQLT
jgi:hypothetical protein